jgi:hypothetical protein
MVLTRNETMEGYNKTVWFSPRGVTNIIALRNLKDQYRVTYDNDDLMFVVHRESRSKPNMEFKMHKSGLDLPFHEGFQVGNSEQSDQRLPRDDSIHLCCNKDLGQEHCRTEREDHSEHYAPGGQVLCEGPQ